MKALLLTAAILFLHLTIFGQNQNISNGNVFDGEPYLVINPSNHQHMVVAWMGWINLANQFKIKTKTTFDGGKTWSEAYEIPHVVSQYSSADPSIAFNNNGEVFVAYIDFTGTAPPVTGGVYICKSTDGGISWDEPKVVIDTNFDGDKWPIDRPWMAIDRSSSSTEGYIYVTTMNLNRTDAPFNPYISISTDNADSFTSKYLDTDGWLAGSLNPLPMCSPTVSSSGVFHGVYPSFEISQNLFLQALIASSSDGGESFSYNTVAVNNPPTNLADYPSAKKGQLLISDPADSEHLASIFLSAINGDLDVFMRESYDGGINWEDEIRINDDPIGNDRMQDMIWGDFDDDGDLIISWRDRRNGTDGSYATDSEIWASYRAKDEGEFLPNFQITNQLVAYDDVLDNAGNDFMCIKLHNDTLNAVWGDTRDGDLNIWFQRLQSDGTIVSTKKISSESIPKISIYPNPTLSVVHIESKDLRKVVVYDLEGKMIQKTDATNRNDHLEIKLTDFPSGTYILEITTDTGIETRRIVKP